MQQEYQAFISYRHADNHDEGRQWANWLHQAIETYDIPKDLIGKENAQGEVIPEKIYPVFRDEEELSIDSNLDTSIKQALDISNHLIVICSPRAVDSMYVEAEIDYYKRLGRSSDIFAVIIDGEPNASLNPDIEALGYTEADECFPKPLQYEYDENQEPSEQLAEPIAADLRVSIEGKKQQSYTSTQALKLCLSEEAELSKNQTTEIVEKYKEQQQLMLLKIISGILGVPLRELTKRDKAYQLEKAQRRAKTLRRWLSAVATFAVIAVIAGLVAVRQTQIAEEKEQIAIEEAEIANQTTDFMVSLFQKSDPEFEMDRDVRVIDILKSGKNRLMNDNSLNRTIRSRLTISMARSFQGLGNYDDGLELANEVIGREFSDETDLEIQLRLKLLKSDLLFQKEEDQAAFDLYSEILQQGQSTANNELLGEAYFGLAESGAYLDHDAIKISEYFNLAEQMLENSPNSYQRLLISKIRWFLSIGDNNQTDVIIKKALTHAEEKFDTLHPLYLETLDLQATLHYFNNKIQSAFDVYQQVLQLGGKLYNEDHPNYATMLVNIARVELELGKLQTSRTHLNQALELDYKFIGEQSSRIGYIKFNQGVIDVLEAKYNDAIVKLNEALTLSEGLDIEGSIYAHLAEAQCKANDTGNIDELLNTAVTKLEGHYPEDNWRIAYARMIQAQCGETINKNNCESYKNQITLVKSSDNAIIAEQCTSVEEQGK